jgi:Outer membrane receptor proteins, mostly Fe transport
MAAAAAFIISSPGEAQNPATGSPVASGKGEVRGRVVTGDNQTPIGIATVELTASAGGTSRRASTRSDGTFRVEGLAAGHYRVSVRALGFTPKLLPTVDIAPSSLAVDIGTVSLAAAPLQLQSVDVTAQKQTVELAPDRNTYVVRDMPTTRGGTALDVLRNVPSVDVDIDNIVSLRGNSGVVVQINGRPSPLKPAQLGNFLAQLPAGMVDKVEIIPNPSARDDPTGAAGIINLALKQDADAGRSGGLTVAGGTTGQVNVGGNVGYQRGALTFYGSYGFLRDRRPRADAIFRQNNYLNPVTYLDESAKRLQLPFAHTVTGSAGYKLTDHDELSLDGFYTTRNQHESYDILYRDLNSARAVTGLSDRNTTGTGHEFNFESTLGYKHTFAEKSHKLSSELRFSRDGEGGPSSVLSDSLGLDLMPLGVADRESQVAWEHPGESSLKIDYVRPLTNSLRMETGYKGSLQTIHTTLDTRVFDAASSSFIPDATRISDFTYRQLVNGAYGMLDAQRGKLQLQAGLRVERATTQFHLKTTDSTYDNPYNSLFPSALVAYDVDDSHQVKLSYSTRIRRPDDTDLLDPTPHYADPLNLSRGNPYLKPEYVRAFELGLQRTGERVTLQVTPFFRRTYGAVRTLRTIDTAGVATRTFANISTSDSYGSDATVALSGSRLSGFAGASAFRQVSNASNLDPALSIRTFGWRLRTNASLRVSRSQDIQALVSYTAPMTVEQGRNASRTQFSIAVRQKLMQDKMNVTLRVIDPFNTSRESSTTIDPRFFQTSERSRRIRGLLLGLNWTFGNAPKSKQDQNDLTGGDNPPP